MKMQDRLLEKPWGREVLPPPFDSDGRQIGEIWFAAPDMTSDVLIKYIFTSEKLSVQVHPSDEQARANGLPGGKEECWFVTHAEPDARLGIGLKQPVDEATLREAALTGAIEDMMDWKPVRTGDFFYIPAGTIHAIGAGIGLLEIQQNADITYRLYDYGRPRELHLDDGMAVALPRPYPQSCHIHIQPDESKNLVDGPYFRVSHCQGQPDDIAGTGPVFVLPISGEVECRGIKAQFGDCLMCDDINDLQGKPGSRYVLARSMLQN
ncbi:MAG: class I mannose-6-phosphate isomerase [Sphingomonadaceae bacterium]